MKKTICLSAAFFLLGSASQAVAENRVESSGGVTLGVQQTDEGSNSSKFTEYRDVHDGFNLYELWFDVLDSKSGRFLDFKGDNLLRDDQSLRLRAGDYGNWRITIDRNEIPHNLSNKAKTPYIYQGNGLYTVPGIIPITDDGTPSFVPTTGEMAVNDTLIRKWLRDNLRGTDLGTQRDKTGASLDLSFLEQFKFRFSYTNEQKDGSKIGYAPIGDRPPRTVNIQLPEPVEYTTHEMRFDAEYVGDWFQTHLSYLFSTFDNDIEKMRWQNLFFTPNAGEDFATTINTGGASGNRNTAAFGQSALAPDNYYHHVSLSGGLDAPMNGRLAGTLAYGYMRQNETLLPYSSSDLGLDWSDPAKLARQNADAEMETLQFDLDYTFNPIARLNMRAFLRYYDLDNNTPTAEWGYVTQDTTSTAGAINYRNYRRNLAYAYDKLNYGIDASHYFDLWRTTLGVGFEREELGRDYREADTDENIYKMSLRSRPTDWLSLRAAYRYGDRESDNYNYNVTSQSYWYTLLQANNDVDNPQFLFANHPDLRKFDVSDRERNQFDLSATIAAMDGLDVTGAYNYRKDDFSSNVSPVAPLADAPVGTIVEGDRFALTPGIQLGLLEEKRQNFSVDAHYAPNNRWTFNIFGNREEIDSTFRGMVFNENQRRNPSNAGIQDIAQLGPWTDPDRIYNAKIKDRTNTIGVGAGYEIIPGKLRFSSDYTMSRGKANLEYSGYGTPEVLGDANFNDGVFQFAFDDPSTVRHNQYVFNATLEYQMFEGMTLGLHYIFDRYSMKDWMQQPDGSWVETVGSEYYLRDTTEDNRWGNRLINMGSNLGPSYETHTGFVTMTYRF